MKSGRGPLARVQAEKEQAIKIGEAAKLARADLTDGMSLEDAVQKEAPSLILGLSGRKGTITPAAVRAMADAHERPMVFPLSNPTSSCEITPEEVYQITGGKAIVATGSPLTRTSLTSASSAICTFTRPTRSRSASNSARESGSMSSCSTLTPSVRSSRQRQTR